MIEKNEEVLAQFRGPGLCENCGCRCSRREPHHWRARGADGGARLDIRINLIALGNAFECGCHLKVENGKISRKRILEIIAKREGVSPGQIQRMIWRILRTPKKT